MSLYIHARAPMRIGIAGGGTDLPAWTKERRGLCIGLSISMYTHAVAISRHDRQVVASYRRLDRADAATEIANGLIREAALLYGQMEGFEIHTMSEVASSGSGLGTSSSIAVCLAAVFREMARVKSGGPEEPLGVFHRAVARDAWTVEIERLHRPIGRQDHMAAVWGGLKTYRFDGDDAGTHNDFGDEDASWVAQFLTLIKLPKGHNSRMILSGVNSCEQLQRAFDSVDVAAEAITDRDLENLGRAIWMGQEAKTRIPGAVTQAVGSVVSKVRAVSGVYGCKVAGAGGGGHLVVLCDPEARPGLCVATGLQVIPVEADTDGLRVDLWS